MISVTELRIGNLVDYFMQDDLDTRKEWWEASTIDVNDLIIIDSGIVENYRYITLTEEWLIKFGIEEANFKNQWRFCTQYLLKEIDDTFSLIVGDEETTLATIKHVHQLQNLYWCLTGKELSL